MPIFEYSCAPCHHRWEMIVSRSTEGAPFCPRCGRPGKKELSAPAFQFKGSGWYVTDYAKPGGKPEGKPDGASEAKPGAPSAEKPGGTPDAKPGGEPARGASTPAPSASPASGGGCATD